MKSIRQRFLDLAAKEAAYRDAAIKEARNEYQYGSSALGDMQMREARKHSQKMLAALDCAKACDGGEAQS